MLGFEKIFFKIEAVFQGSGSVPCKAIFYLVGSNLLSSFQRANNEPHTIDTFRENVIFVKRLIFSESF